MQQNQHCSIEFGIVRSPCWWILGKTNILTYQFLPKINYVASKEESATREPKSLHGRWIEFLVQDPSYYFFHFEKKKHFHFLSFGVLGHLVTAWPQLLFLHKEEENFHFLIFFKMQGSWGLWIIIVWPEYIMILWK